MKKKKLTKYQSVFVDELRERQNRALLNLSGNLKLLQAKLDELSAKVVNEGIGANYSCHSDIREVATRIYTQELTLSTLKSIEVDMLYGTQLKKK